MTDISVSPKSVTQVLLQDGQWYTVNTGTFTIGSYRLLTDNELMDHLLATEVSTPGFSFEEPGGRTVTGPLSSITAIRR
ncbi:hypothetical protein [Streptomyces rubellomurinus]|uniref:Uncharacterized protein n=1 Tax=Streptomyces rubellomurinus (strain ATCC 31215) TaxID=359131 RepID=A0A0F2TEB7_STRR3|nr:hypothetical protein [Streptomyces rubellomurinus]KJS60650.1 hypothetical protein VM95_19700 [Streptomyces rubellomurinus]